MSGVKKILFLSSHAVYVSQPAKVAAVIAEAAKTVQAVQAVSAE